MTTPRHHLDRATIVAYAAGAIAPEFATIVATHLEACAECRRAVRLAEDVGGALMEQQQSQQAGEARRQALRAGMLARLDATQALGDAPRENAPAHDSDRLPAALHPYFGSSYRALKWRWMGPGQRYIRVSGPSGGTLLMLRIAPGKSMPVHGHGGSEMTQILQGAYDDALGHFAAGDVADLDPETQHQPVIASGMPCTCVAALDAPLRFPGWLARLLQPVFGI